jgi:hypothetical protein
MGKKHAILTYYKHLQSQLSDACIHESQLCWKLLKDTFCKTKSTDIRPLENLSPNDISIVSSNDEKAESLHNYFSSICSVDDSKSILPEFFLHFAKTLLVI